MLPSSLFLSFKPVFMSLSVLKASIKSHRKKKLGGKNRTLKRKRLVDISNALREAINKNN